MRLRIDVEAKRGAGFSNMVETVDKETSETYTVSYMTALLASLAALALYGRLVWFGDSSGPPDPVHPDALYPRNLQVTAFWLAADPPERWEAARRKLQEWTGSGAIRVRRPTRTGGWRRGRRGGR